MLEQQLVNGVVLGATYALFAIGFTLMFGVMGVINLTYGVYFALGAFAALWSTQGLGLPIWAALPVGALIAGLIAVLLDTLLLTRLRKAKAPELASLMVTLGATLFLYAGMAAALGTEIRRFPAEVFSGGAYSLGDVRVGTTQILILAAAIVLMLALLALVRGSRIGLAIRAVAENPDAAALMGINGALMLRVVSFLSGAIGGAAGVLVGLNFNAIQPFMGEHMMLRGFAVIIVGGLGDLRGALLAGLLLGLAEVLTAAYLSSTLKDMIAFALLVATLWFRPLGLFGRAAAKRA
ncbi:branched-chain amino acid ABC transporter permease [Methylobacterium frigidaeris]|uniref:High-affinity branched-chain amino acid transport system permease protein LivH n=1 Tax=Methylobacterium frigidaeris TaxID=2038277 RepID=A0AA37H8D1_9HYPH|nr:branched-chain amino acid ABC transporter permease [Methylobacterium frigidaeris]PIK70438.1 branched-chain amino acid ABC transporter permease [Methylobacterium frigidaeris]GJD60844.1 High-affinity branched-chain amino acid transport system permease protein LivH [Methylobacterium frigidaeris]